MPVTKNVDAIMKILESSKDKEELDKTFDALRERIHELSEKMKKSEQKKSEQKKSDQKKPEQKKSEQKKPVQKKPDQKKPEQKKPEQKKSEQKKPKKTDTSTKGTTSLEDEPNYRNVTKLTMIRAIRNNTKSNKDEYIKKLEKIGENAKKPLLYKLVKDAGLIKESIKK